MCDCVTQMNQALKAHNLRLDARPPILCCDGAVEILPLRVLICTEKIEKNRKAVPVLPAAFCPFCGEKYAETREVSP